MKVLLFKLRDAVSDYTVGTVIAVALTAVARRHARLQRALPGASR